GDQLAFNIFFYNKWSKLPMVFNVYMNSSNNGYLKPRNVRGIILHFIGKEKPWIEQSPFYNEWRNNLEKANDINFSTPREGNCWSTDEILQYSRYLRNRMLLSHLFKKPIFKINQAAGKFLLIKFPKTYS